MFQGVGPRYCAALAYLDCVLQPGRTKGALSYGLELGRIAAAAARHYSADGHAAR